MSGFKKELIRYPLKLKHTIIQDSLWSAEFTLMQAVSYAENQDIFNTAGCLTRAVKNIVSALFAINELYPIGDKRAIEILERTDQKPDHLKKTIADILCINRQSPIENLRIMQQLFHQTVALTAGIYHPLYAL